MIKTLAKSIREYKKQTVLAPLLIGLEVIMDILIPYVMSKLVDNGIYGENMAVIYKLGALLILLVGFSITFGILAGKYAAEASTGFAKNLRHDMYYKVQNYSFQNIDKFSTSSIITRMTTDVTYVQNAFQNVSVCCRSPESKIDSLRRGHPKNEKV